MEVVNPYGRQTEDIINDDYASVASTRCKCSAGLYSKGVANGSFNHCKCSDEKGTIGTRVNVG